MRSLHVRPATSLALALLLLTGCTRVVDDARPQRERSVAPIAAGQVEDLLSEKAQSDAGSSLFATVEPDACAGLIREVHAPFVFDPAPVAHTSGVWYDDEAVFPANVVEIIGVYHSDYDSTAALDEVGRTVELCRDDVVKATTSGGDGDDFRVAPGPDSGSSQIVLWSLTDAGEWACDNAFVAAHNAAIEFTACADSNGYDVLALARDALKRIEALANKTA